MKIFIESINYNYIDVTDSGTPLDKRPDMKIQSYTVYFNVHHNKIKLSGLLITQKEPTIENLKDDIVAEMLDMVASA